MTPEATPDAEHPADRGADNPGGDALDAEDLNAEDLGTGLRFFPPGTAPGVSRRRWIFVAISTVAALMVLWPVYPIFARPKPLILGLPLSLAWVLAALSLVFVALLWLFRGEPAEPETDSGDGA